MRVWQYQSFFQKDLFGGCVVIGLERLGVEVES